MAKISASDVKDGAKTFLGSLFDFSFREYIAAKLTGVLFGTAIILGAIFGVVTIIGAFARGSVTAGLISLLVTPIFYFLGIIVTRIWLELVIVLFKIEANTR
jgi:hypothetical protein